MALLISLFLSTLIIKFIYDKICFYKDYHKVRMACGGGGKGGDAPTINFKPTPVPTAEQLFNQSLAFNEANFPLALASREGLLQDFATPESTTAFFESFQPTSFEEALAAQHFANVFPDVERSIKQNLSLSGIASSPILAEQIAKARGDLGVDIGTQLLNAATQRAGSNINVRNLDPNQQILPFVETGVRQAQAQAQQDQLRAQIEFQNALIEHRNRQSGISGIGGAIGAGLGAIAAPFTGGLSLLPAIGIGSGLGKLGASAFGGEPFGFQDALGLATGLSGLGDLSFTNPFAATGGFLKGAADQAIGVFNPLDTSNFGSSISGFSNNTPSSNLALGGGGFFNF